MTGSSRVSNFENGFSARGERTKESRFSAVGHLGELHPAKNTQAQSINWLKASRADSQVAFQSSS